MFEKLLRPDEIALQLRLSKSFVYKLIRTGEITSVRLGRSVRVLPSDLEAFITENRIGNEVTSRPKSDSLTPGIVVE